MGRRAQKNQAKERQGLSLAVVPPGGRSGMGLLMKTAKNNYVQVIIPKNVSAGMSFSFHAPLGHPTVTEAALCRPPPGAPPGGFWVKEWWWGPKTNVSLSNPVMWPIHFGLTVMSFGVLGYAPSKGGVLTQDEREVYTVWVGKVNTSERHIERYFIDGTGPLDDSYWRDNKPNAQKELPRVLTAQSDFEYAEVLSSTAAVVPADAVVPDAHHKGAALTPAAVQEVFERAAAITDTEKV